MNRVRQHLGMTLIEITVVVAIIAMLVGFGVPAVRALINSAQSESTVRTMVQSMFDTARTLAMANQAYVGVRFQKAYDAETEQTDQYMILVKHDPQPRRQGYANEYHALVGHKPVRVPSQYYLADLKYTVRSMESDGAGVYFATDADVNEADMTSFTVLFSATGQMVVGHVRVRNADGKPQADAHQSNDRVFNTKTRIDNPAPPDYPEIPGPVFLLDDDTPGRHAENSRDRFFILGRDRLEQATKADRPWQDYLRGVSDDPILVSPFNGQLIEARPL